jgi:ABC-type multidrug transport system ATPase subunit
MAGVIEIRGLTLAAEGRTIVSGFSLVVEKGARAAVTGPSGSGKTTVLKAVMGFVEPRGGSISIGGVRLDGRTVWRARREMAYVPQEIDLGGGTARDALVRPFGYRAASSVSWDEGRAREMLEEFGLEGDLLGQELKCLSGGEKRRLALVTALLLERPVLVLDEITSGLDLERKKAIVRYLERRRDITVLAASHDEAFLECATEAKALAPRTGAQRGAEEA